ncbi:molecular chaperone DnaJ, partial [Candidatus Kaiserbacteria bacterium CG10_big_fil_rev_8_21_14_0_10_44_10]
CGSCAGTGVKRSPVEIKIKVPTGINDGEVIRMVGQGEAMQGAIPGDLYIKIHVIPDKHIKREGNSLYQTLPVKLTDALLGAEYKIETLDGPVTIKVPANVQHNEVLRIKEKGVPVGNRRGDFLVKIDIELPTKLSRNAKKLIEELKGEGI